MNERNGDFTYAELIQMYSELLKKYKIILFSDGLITKEKHPVLIRHDVDILPEKALRIGLIERDLSIRSAYFFMTSCPLYNIFSDRVQKIISRLKSWGHEIGLHYDQTSQVADIHCMKDIFQKSMDCQLNLISFHKPDGDTPKGKYCFGMLNVFAKHFTDNFKYFSDSWGMWRFGHPLKSAEFGSGKPLYLNIHPEWWSDVPGIGIGDVKEKMIRRYQDIVEDYWKKDIIPGKETL